jgi:hypothetical protein
MEMSMLLLGVTLLEDSVDWNGNPNVMVQWNSKCNGPMEFQMECQMEIQMDWSHSNPNHQNLNW